MRIPYLQCLRCLHSPLRALLFAALLYLFAPGATQAQAQNNVQPVYIFASVPSGAASQIAAFSVDSAGALKAAPGSPFNETREGGFVAVDPLNQFVFVLNAASNDISVFSIDPATGALADLTAVGSPFAAPAPTSGGAAPSGPICMATFKNASGSYLYVAYRNGSAAFTGAIEEFQIGTSSQPLLPVSTTTTDGTPVSLAVSPQGNLYAAIQVALGSAATPPSPTPGVAVFAIDPISGVLNISTFASSNLDEDSLALSPTGTFLFDGAGTAADFIESALLEADGSAGRPEPVALGSNSLPSAMLVDGNGHFLYVREGAQTVVYAIDQTTGALTTPPRSVPQLPLSPGNTVADPLEAYLYSLQSGQLQVLHIDPASGALAQIGSTVKIADGGGAGGLAITNSAAPTVAGLNAGFAPPALSFPETSATQPSQPELIHLINTGTQPLDTTLSSIVITGADAADFVLTQSCTTPLQPHASCTISIIFTPAIAAPRQATLTVTDAAGTQSALLSGTGLSAQPGASLAPSTLTFAPTAIASSAASQSVVLTNSGDATLHISSILAGGINSADFAIASATGSATAAPAACATTTPYPPNASCSITIAFTPLGAGARSASIIIADDAPGSTQTALLSGTGTGAPVPRPAATLSAAALSFTSPVIGQKSPPQSVTITSTGTSPLSITSVALNDVDASDFTLINNCTASSYTSPNGCTITIAFTPSAPGSRIATLVITDNDPSSPQSVSLSGVTQPAETLTITPTTNGVQQSITAGQTATFQFNLAANFSGTVNFSPCSGAPASATCTVQPAPINVTSGQASVAFSISVATVAASTVLEKFDDRRPVAPIAPAQISFATACALILLVRRKKARRAPGSEAQSRFAPRTFAISASALFACTALLALALITVTGCGGASTVETAATITPTAQSQTFTIVVTPTATTSDSLSVPNVQPIQLTLVVN